MVERIKSGRDSEIKQKLVSSIHKKIVVANDLPKDIVIDTEECVDGSRPSILIRIKRIVGRKKTRICR
ncbi:MAG: hypothetical protein WAN82_00035 [Candidatus Bathyarchaeia archaeon]|jgi:hypothetical protein